MLGNNQESIDYRNQKRLHMGGSSFYYLKLMLSTAVDNLNYDNKNNEPVKIPTGTHSWEHYTIYRMSSVEIAVYRERGSAFVINTNTWERITKDSSALKVDDSWISSKKDIVMTELFYNSGIYLAHWKSGNGYNLLDVVKKENSYGKD